MASWDLYNQLTKEEITRAWFTNKYVGTSQKWTADAILHPHWRGQKWKTEYKEEVYDRSMGMDTKHTCIYVSQLNTCQIIHTAEKCLNNYVDKRLIQWISAHVSPQLPQHLHNMLMEQEMLAMHELSHMGSPSRRLILLQLLNIPNFQQ